MVGRGFDARYALKASLEDASTAAPGIKFHNGTVRIKKVYL